MGRLEQIPLFIGCGAVLIAFASCYCISTLVLSPPLEFFLPTISELGDRPPASCIFSLCFSLASFCFAWLVMVRYKDMQNVLQQHRRMNTLMLICGMFWCLGMLIVATFQSALVPGVHYAGALALFVGSTIYVWLNIFMSSKLAIWRETSSHLLRLRFALAVLQTIGFVALIGFAIVWKVRTVDGSLFWWKFVALSEYCVAISFGFSLISFTNDLGKLDISFSALEAVLPNSRSLNDSVRLIDD